MVIGGDSVSQVMESLDILTKLLEQKVIYHDSAPAEISDKDGVIKMKSHGYMPAALLNFNSLATIPRLSYLVENKWAMFPDHVVFLGERALIGSFDEIFESLEIPDIIKPPFIFCKDVGTFQITSVTKTQIDQLICFYDIAVRQSDVSKVVTLSKEDVDKLLHWDAEKYRTSIAK